MKKTLPYAIAAALVTGAMGFSTARATITMNWQQPQTISGDGDVVTNGDLVTAWNTGNNDGLTTTVNGVPFADHWSNQQSGNTSLTGGANVIGFCNGTIGSTNYTALIAAATYLDTTVQVTGLTPGIPYLFEWWANDNRGSIVAGRQAIATVGLNSVTLQENSGPSSTGFGQFVVGKFVADSTGTLTVNFTGNPSGDGILNAFQLREIPEPSAAVLSVLGGLLAWRRGRRSVRA